MSAKIYLVGAGPGDPELLTRKAWRVLQSADVILHDDLVSEDILQVLPAGSQIINVGKRCGGKGISQSEINDWMVNLASSGQTVVRLKSGDPLLFGRAGEEMEALRRANIEFEVVPGVTAALGAAASAKISLTDRRHASRVVFLTAHRAGGTRLSKEGHVAADTTYVIYMPGPRYSELIAELQGAGIAPEVPCVLISRATARDETIQLTSVGNLANCDEAASPSILIVGGVALAAVEKHAPEMVLSSESESDFLSLALQHPSYDSHGRGF